jgi:outer membrane lipoprotein-sorting protein
MRRSVVGVGTVLFFAALSCGCSDSSSDKNVDRHVAAQGSATTLLGGKSNDYRNEAEQLLRDMIAAYQKADSYADRGELRITFRRDGRLFESKVPFSVVFVRPNQLQMHYYQGHVVGDGKQLWGWTDDLPGYVWRRSATGPLKLDDVYADEVLGGVLSKGQAGGSLQLAMLLGADAFDLLRAGGELPEMLSDGEIGDRVCRRVRIRRDDGSLIYWIDRDSLVLRRVEYPTQRALRAAAFAAADDLTMTAEFIDPALNPTIASSEAFRFEPPPTAKVVEKLDPFAAVPPPPPLASTLGTAVSDFQAVLLDGRTISRNDLRGKTAVVLFWSMEQGDSLTALDGLNAVYAKYRSRPEVTFLAVNIDPAGENGFSDAELRGLFSRNGIEVAAARDAAHSAVRSFEVQYVPNLFLVGKNGVIEDNEIGLNPQLVDELPRRIDRLAAGESLVSDARSRYAERVRKFEQAQQAAGGGGETAATLPQAKIAPAREPQHLKMKRLWRSTDVAKPGYVLTTAGTGPPRIVVADGLRSVAELDSAGKLVRKIDLDLPTSPTEAIVGFWRTAVDKQGRRLFVGSASAQQQLHVFDADFKRLLSFPEGTHAGISDVQVGDLDGDGEPELLVGYWGVVGVQGVKLDGTRIWSNRRLPENVLRLAVTPLTPLGKRRLLCNTGLMTLAVLDERGESLIEMPIGGRSLRLVAAADLRGDGATALCGVATLGPGNDSAVGFDVSGAELWNYPLPPGVHPAPELQNEMIVSGKLLPNEPGMWIFAGADGTVHLVGGDGRAIDVFAWGEPLHGLAVAEFADGPALVIADGKGVSAVRLSR